MKNWPTPWNPESLPPPAPGYRYIGEDEPLNLDHDEIYTLSADWGDIGDKGHKRVPHWTYRRAICVDDKNAPPPAEWVSKPGFEVVKGPLPYGEYEGWLDGWKSGYIGDAPHKYYRRPIPSMSTLNQATSVAPKVTLKPGQSIVVDTCNNQVLAEAVNQIAKNAGWDGIHSNRKQFLAIHGPGHKWAKKMTHEDSVDWYKRNEKIPSIFLDARTDMGLLIDLLAAPAIEVPKINGYEAKYTKGADVVEFGCAKIAIGLFRNAGALMRLTADQGGKGPWRDCNVESIKGNRTVQSITLSSGVVITHEQVKSVLNYVDTVNKA